MREMQVRKRQGDEWEEFPLIDVHALVGPLANYTARPESRLWTTRGHVLNAECRAQDM